MIIYADILVFVNTVTDYFLILLTSRFCATKIKEWRLIVSAFGAGLTSLYIFFTSKSFIFDIFIRLAFVVLITAFAFGFHSKKYFIRHSATLLLVTLIYNGLMVVIWTIFKPKGMLVHQTVVYFNISAVEMIIYSVLAYLLLCLGQMAVKRLSPNAKRCFLRLENKGNVFSTRAIVDTGNSLKDIYFNRTVIITDKPTAQTVLGDISLLSPLILPYHTIEKQAIINAYTCEKAVVGTKEYSPVLLAVSECKFDDDYRAIVNPDSVKE